MAPSFESLQQRTALAEHLRRLRQEVAEQVTAEFLARHPDWLERYGERARTHGVADALFHQDFLAGAIEADSPAAFQDYTRWTAGMLAARGIDPAFVRENLRQIGDALGARLAETERGHVVRFIDAGCATAEATPESAPSPEATSALRSVYVQALLQGARRPALTVVLDAVDRGWNIADLYSDVLQPAMYEIGRLWESNRITVAEEHTATAITQHVLAHLYERLPRPTQLRGRAVITGVAGELHQVGAHIVADALEADGWDVRFLGTNMPHAGIIKILEEHQPHAVGISATMLFNVASVRRLVDEIRDGTTRPVRIVLGGAAFRMAGHLAAEIGADGFATDVREAVQLFRSLVPAA
jgi:methanogenic corrinoid protein MtbC1